MMSEFVCMLTEYIGIILCLHAFTKVRKEINLFNIILGVINVSALSYIDRYSDKRIFVVMLLFLTIFLYVKMKLEQSWFNAVKIWGIMMVVIPSLQLGLYTVMKMCFKSSVSPVIASAISNILMCVLFYFWNEKFLATLVMKIRRKLWGMAALIFILSIVYLAMIYKVERLVQAEVMLQTVGIIWGLLLFGVIILIMDVEKKNRERELKIYQVYNESFEEAIFTIRQRQHEFANHINALKDMQYTIHDTKELIEERNRYCDSLLKENELNGLLKQDLEPIIISVLYTKLLTAQNAGIEVSQKVHAIDFKKRIEIVELVEIIGILVDNAVEALSIESQVVKKLRVRILQEADKHFSVEVANSCKVLLQSEIENFTKNGYSTKGTDRGLGLVRLLTISEKNNAEISMGNIMYEGHNYFSVKVYI